MTWQEELSILAEKHCQHDNSKFNNCLFYIFKPFIETEIIEKLITDIDKESWDESGKGDYQIDWAKTKQQLRDKWL